MLDAFLFARENLLKRVNTNKTKLETKQSA